MTSNVNKKIVLISEADLSTLDKKLNHVNQIVYNMKVCNKKVIDSVL